MEIPPTSVSQSTMRAIELGIMTDRPRHPEYSMELERLKSYTGFPCDLLVAPSVLAKAGFFYTGSGDCVRCFHCDLGLRHWEPGDEPWEEHARWYPKCTYILGVKGREYIQHIQEKHGRVYTTPLNAVVKEESSSTTQPLQENTGSQSSWLTEQMNLPMTKAVLEMGYSRVLVSAVIERKNASDGAGFPKIHSLLEAIFKIEESGNHDLSSSSTAEPVAAPAGHSAGKAEQKEQQQQQQQQQPAAGGQGAKQDAEKPCLLDSVSILEENRQLKEQQLCKVCRDNDVKIVFLPCGHLCCCATCAPVLARCPICRQFVRGTVRVYLS